MTHEEMVDLPVGTLVELTPLAIERGICHRTRPERKVGFFAGITRDGRYCKILRRGVTTTETYYPGFWRPIEVDTWGIIRAVGR